VDMAEVLAVDDSLYIRRLGRKQTNSRVTPVSQRVPKPAKYGLNVPNRKTIKKRLFPGETQANGGKSPMRRSRLRGFEVQRIHRNPHPPDRVTMVCPLGGCVKNAAIALF
jgi:hypothetical protein